MTIITKAKCDFCGHERQCAEWHGSKGFLYCCHVCAERELPRFLADAIQLPGASGDAYGLARAAWARSEGYLWKAIASSIASRLSQQNKD